MDGVFVFQEGAITYACKTTIALATFVAAAVFIGQSGKVQGQEDETNSPSAVVRSIPLDAAIKVDGPFCPLWNSRQEYEEGRRLFAKPIAWQEYMRKHTAALPQGAVLRLVKNHTEKPLGWDVIVDPNILRLPNDADRENIKRDERMFLALDFQLPHSIALPYFYLGEPIGVPPQRLRIGVMGKSPPPPLDTMRIVDIDWGPFTDHFYILGSSTIEVKRQGYLGQFYTVRYLAVETVATAPIKVDALEQRWYDQNGFGAIPCRLKSNPDIGIDRTESGERYSILFQLDDARLDSLKKIKISYAPLLPNPY